MKVVAIISSLRKKNTLAAVKRIESVHQTVCPCEYEYVFLRELNLLPCTGCHLCLTKGEEYCPLKDDRDLLLAKIESSDAVILASPNHTKNVNWLMKNYIDRLSYLMHRPRFFGKRFMLLVTSGSYMGVKEALRALEPIVSGGSIVGRLGVMNSPGMTEKKRAREDKRVDKAAMEFAKALKHPPQFRATLMNMLWFSAFRATSGAYASDFPADFRYYEHKQFFTQTRLGTYHRMTMGVFTRLFAYLVAKGMV